MQAFSYKGNEYFPGGTAWGGYDSRGTAYEIGSYGSDDDVNSKVFLASRQSTDGGNTWSTPTPALGRPDALITGGGFVIDTSARSAFLNAAYLTAILQGPVDNDDKSQVVVSHSYDGGNTWTQVPVAPVQKLPAEDAFSNIAVGPDGSLYVVWMYCATYPAFCQEGPGKPRKSHIILSRSTDGGNTWSRPSLVATVIFGSLQNYPFLLPNPLVAVDDSGGPYSGTIYMAMSSAASGTLHLEMIRSRDGGDTWSSPVPVAPAEYTHDQFMPWLSISPTGIVGMSWMDRRNDPNDLLYQPFAAFSSDGGQSFGTNILLSEGFSDPTRGGEGNGWIGDYTGNTWAGPNYFVAAWMDNSQTPNMEDVVGGIRLK